MISWQITTTKPAQTGLTSFSESSSRSSSRSIASRAGATPQNPSSFSYSSSESESGSFSAFAMTSNGESSRTIRSSSTANAITSWVDSENGTRTTVVSTGESGETVTDFGTWEVETSTTETYEATLASTYTSIFELVERSVWTTSEGAIGGTQTQVHFYTTELTSFTDIRTSFATQESTQDATTTTTTETLAGNVAFATVVRADARDASAEILWLVTNRPPSWNGYTAVTALAQSGTRFTLVPTVSTEQMSAISTQAAISTFAASQSDQTASLTYATTSTQTSARTVVQNRFVVPNQTTTQSFRSTVSASGSMTYVVIPAASFTYGYGQTWPGLESANTTRMTTVWGQTWETKRRWNHTLSFHYLVSRPVSSQISTLWPLDITKSFSSAAATEPSATTLSTGDIFVSGTFTSLILTAGGGLGWSLSSASATETYEYYTGDTGTGEDETTVNTEEPSTGTDSITNSTVQVSGSTTENGQTIQRNTYVPLSSAVSSYPAGSQINRTSWVESGAFAGSAKGLFITATKSLIISNTARHGASVYVSRYFPQTAADYTINNDSITFKTTTSTTGSVTSAATTASMTMSAHGSTFASGIGGQGVGGGPFSATIVERATPGVYKNRIDGQTASFDGADTSYAPEATGPLKKWFPVEGLVGMGNASAPLLLVVPRNSTAIPPGA